jgi:hypothetical protein
MVAICQQSRLGGIFELRRLTWACMACSMGVMALAVSVSGLTAVPPRPLVFFFV